MTDEGREEGPNLFDDIEYGVDDYSDADVLEHAQLNAQALLLATVELLRDHPEALKAWREGLVDIYLRAWNPEREWSAAAILDALLTNFRSFGGSILEHDAGDAMASATVTGLPDRDLVAALGVDAANVGDVLATARAVAGHLGGTLDASIDPETGDIRLTVETGGKGS